MAEFLAVMGGIPHTRGGEPALPQPIEEAAKRIPHTRGGEPEAAQEIKKKGLVFPTRVGVNRLWETVEAQFKEYSPHAWG